MRCAIHAKSEKPSKIAAGSKTINSKITSRYMAQSSVDVHIGSLALKLDTSGVARAVSPKEAGLRVQDWDMWLKFLCVSRCWICCASLQLVAWLCRCYFSRLRRGLGSHLGLRGQGTRTQRFDGAVPLRHLRCLETAKNEGDYPLSEGMIKRVACIGFCRSFSASKRLC